MFFTTLVGMLVGLRSAEPVMFDLIRAYGGGRVAELMKVRIRAALPSLFAALRIAAPAAILGAIIGEYLGGESGIGIAMIASQTSLRGRTAPGGSPSSAGLLAGLAYGITAFIGRAAHAVGAEDGAMTATDSLPALEPEKVSAPHASGAPEQNKWCGRRHGGALAAAHDGARRSCSSSSSGSCSSRSSTSTRSSAAVRSTCGTTSPTGPVGAAARDQLWDASVTTLTDAGVGLLAGASVARARRALRSTCRRRPSQTFMPLAIVLRSVPLVGDDADHRVDLRARPVSVTVIAGIVTFFPVLVNVSLALRSAPKAALDLCQAYGASPVTTLRKVQVPTALPALFASLRIAAPLAIIGAQLAEWLATGKGLGYLMLQSVTLSNYNMLWSATVLVTMYSIVVYSIIGAIESSCSPSTATPAARDTEPG